MMVLVDTSVWSLALRRRQQDLSAAQKRIQSELVELIREGRVQLLGVVRQELLSGVRSETQYESLRTDLHAFDDPRTTVPDYEEAARVHNQCRAKGVQGSTIDFLICAIALRRNWTIFTTDQDFVRYARHLPVRLHEPRRR